MFAVELLFAALLMAGCGGSDDRHAPLVWRSDNHDGTYVNPVLHADYSDPDVIRVGEEYILTSSSFSSSPGLPILRSRDLVNWSIIAHALPVVPPEERYAIPRYGEGVWAPSIRHHNGAYLIYYGDPDVGIFRVSATDPAGPWSEPLLVQSARGWIDPSPFWDEDGQAYLVHAWAKSRAGFNSILTLRRMNAEGTALTGDSVNVFSAPERHPTIEGPKMYRRNGLYYIFAPAGGVKEGWQVVLRAPRPTGPYEDRTVLHQGRTDINGPHQGAWVEDITGASWFIHFQDKGPYGRITHLQPLTWHEGWPLIGADNDGDGVGEPVRSFRKPVSSLDGSVCEPQTSDEFDHTALGLQWQWQANRGNDAAGFRLDNGHLVLNSAATPFPGASLRDCPAILLQKLPAPSLTATVSMKVSGLTDGDRAGLVILGSVYQAVGVRRSGGTLIIETGTGRMLEPDTTDVWTEAHPLTGDDILLRATIDKHAACQLSISMDGATFKDVAPPFHVLPGKWVGARMGVYAVAAGTSGGGWVSLDWFRVSPNP